MSGALESFWAAGRTLGHGCPSWTLLCHLAAAICNCDNLALPRPCRPLPGQ